MSPKTIIKKVIITSLITLPVYTAAQAPASQVVFKQDQQDVDEDSLVVRGVRWTESKRDSISASWLSTAHSIDSWMSGNESRGRNKSRINVGVKQEFRKYGNNESDFYIRGKIDVPNTKRKLKIFFDSETNDQDSLENKKLDTAEDTYTTAGVGRTKQVKNFSFSNEIGAKFRVPLDPFYRFKAEYDYAINDNWKGDIEQKVWYYHEKGWGESTEFSFSRELSEQYGLRVSTEAQFQNRYKEFEFGQFFTLYQNIADNYWNSFTFGVVGSNQPNPRVNNYFLSASYKKPVYEDWVVVSVNPRLRFPREDNWKPNPELEFRLDVYFQEDAQ
jgi:hypothetical protein